ncbi:DUF1963 domain-containing protein [Urbifossiella limnaea]|uniref:DUF1963 domain-containing protein n=1 Tax=Urbifossiella limnaea TaxID=2528023 RepID=A0A517XNG6_9BACT|nr:DUF1963 domain-containing protein [Urbifossiella limnaea]QDU19051.1 hypothetical protein ETAA1_09540 [Urbifossiella limnaea]
MQADEIVATLEPWRARNRRPAWTPVVEAGDGPATASKFCGTPWTGPDAPWPDCGLCRRPLQPFLQLDLDDLPDELGRPFGTGLLQLFYCTREECQGAGGWAPFADDLSRVRVVHPGGGGPATPAPEAPAFPAKRIVGWTRLDDLPGPQDHDDNGLTYTYDFKAGTLRFECPEVGLDHTGPINACPAEQIATAAPGDKLGGWPYWVQGAEYPACPRCARRMALVFQLDSEGHVPFMFGDAGCGHVTQCPEHKDVVAFGWACG